MVRIWLVIVGLSTCHTVAAQPIDTLTGTRAPDLVNVGALDSTLHLEVRYATPNNFLGRRVYPYAAVFLQRPAAEALLRAHRRLLAQGYGLLLYDGYRPWRVTKLFWDSCAPAMRYYLAPPRYGSIHNRGCSIDCSLYDRRTGKPVAMPTDYDVPSPLAAYDAPGGTAEQRAHRDRLIAALRAEGFAVQPNEWWHFNYRAWRQYPILDIPFLALLPR